MSGFPLPTAHGRVVVPAPGEGPGNWVGAPSAALDADGGIVLAYRIRTAAERGSETVVARSGDGESFEIVAVVEKGRFGAASMERPACVRTESGRWRLYVCAVAPDSWHWWIDVLEAGSPEELADAEARTVFAGDGATAVKDPVVRQTAAGWEAWICCHAAGDPGGEDRMWTAYATSRDGLDWDWHGTALAPRAGRWDARGARVTAVLPDGRAAYDGRATKEENFFERTGLARRAGAEGGTLVPAQDEPVSHVRYLDVLPLPDGGYRLFYEAPLPDASHELRTDYIAGT